MTRNSFREYVENGVVAGDRRSQARKRPHLFTPDECAAIVAEVESRPTLYLDELAYEVYCWCGKFASTATLFRVLKRGGMSLKVITKLHFAKNEMNKDVFAEAVSEHDFAELVWFDETGQQERRNFRKRGRGRKGRRVCVKMPKFGNERCTLAASMSFLGPGPCRLVQGSLNAERFMDYMEEDLLPNMNAHYNGDGSLTSLPHSVLILDNCSTHRCRPTPPAPPPPPALTQCSRNDEFFAMCARFRIKLIFLPPYTPECNPIELAFNTLKTALKRDAIHMSVMEAPHLHAVDLWLLELGSDTRKWCRYIKHAGYTVDAALL